jgi:hypothetical protein
MTTVQLESESFPILSPIQVDFSASIEMAIAKVIPLENEVTPEVKYVLFEKLKSKVNYPFGPNIKENIPYVKIIAEEFTTFWNNLPLQEKKSQKINILCRGSSGAMMAALFSAEIIEWATVKISHIKKIGEDAHNNDLSVSPDHFVIIIDDFISSGATVNAIYDQFLAEVDTRIDLLCVTGNVYEKDIRFKPKYIMCHHKGEK